MSETPLFDRTFSALLFDMDGTIISSVASAERVWAAWAERHGLDVAAFLPRIHGVRGIDVISQLGLPGVDPEAEVQAVLLAEMEDMGSVAPIEGAAAFLASASRMLAAIVASTSVRCASATLFGTPFLSNGPELYFPSLSAH